MSGAELDARVTARKVFLVLSSRGERPRDVEVLLDGKPVNGGEAGADVSGRPRDRRGASASTASCPSPRRRTGS